tara:strand:- start:3566 stop:3937 length:372 start_codon:yes stop_codon:yes gene_type:complete
MKSHILSIALVSLLFSITGFSQTLIQKETNIDTSDLHFLPSSTTDFVANFSTKTSLKKTDNKKNSFLLGTGYLLQGLKFSSVIDQFNATAPFDARGFEPASFSSYSDLIETNYLLLNPTKPVK